jgi:WD40 repeat protein
LAVRRMAWFSSSTRRRRGRCGLTSVGRDEILAPKRNRPSGAAETVFNYSTPARAGEGGCPEPLNSYRRLGGRRVPQSSRFVLVSADKTAKLYDGTSGLLLTTLKGHTDRVAAAAFSPDGSLIVTASADKTAKLWDATSGRLVTTLKAHTEAVRSARLSPDGSRVVTGSDAATVKLWDARSGRLLMTLEETAQIRHAAFSSDGKRIVTSNADGKAKLWDATTGQFLVSARP